MTPQMKQILEQFDNLPLCYPDIESDDTEQYYAGQAHMKQHMREFVIQSCIEYAKSIMPPVRGRVDASISKLAHDRAHGFNKCIECIYDLIEQDSQNLQTKKTL